jgi:hypothetical protein
MLANTIMNIVEINVNRYIITQHYNSKVTTETNIDFQIT